jgi:hypothetical protein
MTQHAQEAQPANADERRLWADADGVSALGAICLMRFAATARAGQDKRMNDDAFARLAGHIAWPQGALTVVQACQPQRRKNQTDDWVLQSLDDDDEEVNGEANEAPLAVDPVDAVLQGSPGGYEASMARVFNQQGPWLRRVLMRSIRRLERQLQGRLPLALDRLEELGRLFGWTLMDTQVAQFIWLSNEHMELRDFLDGELPARSDPALLMARVMGCAPASVRKVLENGSGLTRSGLVEFQGFGSQGMNSLPNFHGRVVTLLRSDDFSTSRLLEQLLDPSPAPRLEATDFAHLAEEAGALGRLLKQAARSGEHGINVLIYGPPGTGKTEFARWLVATSGLRSFEIPVDQRSDSGDTNPAQAAHRPGLVTSAHRLLAGLRDTVLIFDEAEDAFPVSGPYIALMGVLGDLGPRRRGGGSDGAKAWFNSLLEGTPVPTVWICNAVRQIDPAHLRRFTFHLETRRPSQRVRQRIATQRATLMNLPAEVAQPLANYPDASPAMIDSALRFARLGSPPAAPVAYQAKLAMRGLRAGLSVAGLADQSVLRLSALPFEPEYIHWKEPVDLEALLAGLRRTGQASLCLHGAPGTGKTSFAQYLADQLDRPMLLKRASDLQDWYVGETEKNLQAMFKEASDEGAVLLLDEADSFLFDRQTADRNWERTQVNELLQGMERFEGIFIAATNLFCVLDRAALRRFTFKLEFLPPTREQRVALVLRELSQGLCDEQRRSLAEGVAAMHGLTPGDIVVVVRRARLLSLCPSAEQTLLLLRAELRARGADMGSSIGFKRDASHS